MQKAEQSDSKIHIYKHYSWKLMVICHVTLSYVFISFADSIRFFFVVFLMA